MLSVNIKILYDSKLNLFYKHILHRVKCVVRFLSVRINIYLFMYLSVNIFRPEINTM